MWYKDQDGFTTMEERHFSLEILRSMREIDVRIDELKSMLSTRNPTRRKKTFADWLKAALFYELRFSGRGKQPRDWNKDRRRATRAKVERLIKTRFGLMYSFMDLNGYKKHLPKERRSRTNPFDNIGANYEQLKRHRGPDVTLAETQAIPRVRKGSWWNWWLIS